MVILYSKKRVKEGQNLKKGDQRGIMKEKKNQR